MNRSRTLATAVTLLVLGAGTLTACGSDSTDEPRSMSTTSVIDDGPTSGIRSEAASPAAESTQDSAPTPEVTDRQTEMASPAGEAVGKQNASKSAEPSESCADSNATKAVNDNIGKVPPPFPDGHQKTDWVAMDLSTYDSCSTLSWVTLSIKSATASSPYTQMLFHNGDYLGTTTSQAIGFYPTTDRLDDSSIQVTYTYVEGNESNADASGRAVSTYTWNESTESIDHAGEWPPGIG
ncbi:LppP/LprE family lipoprotein [Kocuria tytonicola]|uniref:LppP/LprE family lipoprotein n=1 Tax=Kocuria tytonicola TaxID=2055946 RepID=A0A3L9L996_9MICC|nr:LppP/LprE family lipoprotein [Kocuria tytonicola]RLY94519.1 LppP/LprE family lipoprotein [Kocuria tytonicola]